MPRDTYPTFAGHTSASAPAAAASGKVASDFSDILRRPAVASRLKKRQLQLREAARLVYNCVSMIGHSSKTTASNPRNLVIRYVQKLHYTSSSICRPCRLFLRCYSKSVPIICSFALIPTSARKKFCQSVNFPSCQSVLPPVWYMLSRAYRGYRYPWIYLCVDTRLRLYPILGF